MQVFFSNNILIQTIIFLPVFSSKYVRYILDSNSIDSNICISIRLWYIFQSKTNIDGDSKENFRTEVVKKGLAFAAIQQAVLKLTYNLCFAHV